MSNNLPYSAQHLQTNKHTTNIQSTPNPQSAILNFNHSEYPFLNSASKEITALKTIVNLSLNPTKLEKIVRLDHPNIIGIRKIVKSSSRQPSDSTTQRQYSFYYQLINFSLLFLAEKPEANPRLSNLLFASNLNGMLNSVVQYLQELQIYYKPKLQDIGISLDGNIKLFLSPLVIFESKYETGVQRAIRQITQWWDNYIRVRNSNIFKKEKKQLQPPQLLPNNELDLQEATVPDSTLQKELGDLLAEEEIEKQPKVPVNVNTNSLSRVGTSQLQKIKMIDQQVKFIRERLSKIQPKTTTNHKQKGQSEQPQNPVINAGYQPKQMKQQQQYFRQPIQQNINCINIYNHNNHISPPPQNNNYYPSRPLIKNPYFDPQLIKEHQEDEQSLDTYDIEFDNAFDNAEPINKNKVQNNRGRDRQQSQYSVQVRKKKKEGLDKGNKKYYNIVCNKNYTESAGPLEFQSIMGRYLLPEDKDTKKQEGSRMAGQAGKMESAISISNYAPQSIRSATIDKTIKHTVLGKINADILSEKDRMEKIKRIHSQNELGYKAMQSVKESEIEQKVRKALQKTKNAIALLNRVKSIKQIKKWGT